MILYHQGQPLEIGDAVNAGGEGLICPVKNQPSKLAKIYRSQSRTGRETKLRWMLANAPNDPGRSIGHASIAWPEALLYDRQGIFMGYVMPRITNAHMLLQVFNPHVRAQNGMNCDGFFLHRVARNLAAAIGALHARDYVIGDLNECNILVTSKALVTVIDTDSFQVREEHDGQIIYYPCPVGRPEYTPPELHGTIFKGQVRQPEQDAFSLGVLIFQTLLGGSHPFRSIWRGKDMPPPIEEKIQMGLFPYDKKSCRPEVAPHPRVTPEVLYPPLVELIRLCFVEGHHRPKMRPLPADWEKALMEAEKSLCTCTKGHVFSGHLKNCPQCNAKPLPVYSPKRNPVQPAPVAPQPVPTQPTTIPIRVTTSGTTMARSSRWNWFRNHPAESILVFVIISAVLIIRILGGGSIFRPIPLPTPTEAPVQFTEPPAAAQPILPSILPTSVPPRPTRTPLPTETSTPFVLVTRVSKIDNMIQVSIPKGIFSMGSNDGEDNQKPMHAVFLNEYWIDQTEVTNAQYKLCVTAGKCKKPLDLDSKTSAFYTDSSYKDYPVVFVDWNQADAYCQWAGRRQPTEAEWEKAARGRDGRLYPWGNQFDGAIVNFCDVNCWNLWKDPNSNDGYVTTSPAGIYPQGSSPYSVLDMTGNVYEWVFDWSGPYQTQNQYDPTGPANGSEHILRGGSWGDDRDHVTTVIRSDEPPDLRRDFIGFRCAQSASP